MGNSVRAVIDRKQWFVTALFVFMELLDFLSRSGLGGTSMAEKYITEEQRAGCQKVADAFAELYELTDVVVADAGRFGFVRLQWFSEGEGFDSAMAFSDSGELFEELWRIWYEHEVLTPVLGTPLAELDYDEIFQTLSKDRQEEITEKKKYFLARCKDAFS